jgi:hypothetical protein
MRTRGQHDYSLPLTRQCTHALPRPISVVCARRQYMVDMRSVKRRLAQGCAFRNYATKACYISAKQGQIDSKRYCGTRILGGGHVESPVNAQHKRFTAHEALRNDVPHLECGSPLFVEQERHTRTIIGPTSAHQVSLFCLMALLVCAAHTPLPTPLDLICSNLGREF